MILATTKGSQMLRFGRKAVMAFGIVVALCCLQCLAAAQSFEVDTNVSSVGMLNIYDFTLNYVQSGVGQLLQSDIYLWTFYLDPNTSEPTDVLSPIGWKYIYDASTGEFDWYTEGPNGLVNGDYGSHTLQSGQILAGFELQTPLTPALSIAFASDTQSNTDLNFATIPAFAPPANVPEPSGIAVLVRFVTMGAMLKLRRKRR